MAQIIISIIILIIGLGIFAVSEESEYRRLIRTAAGIICPVIIIAIFAFSGIRVIGTTEGAAVKRFGKIDRVIYAGLHFINPVSQSLEKYDLSVRQEDLNYDAYTRDGQTVSVQMIIQYTIQKDKLAEITEEYGSQKLLSERITRVAEAQSKTIFSKQTAMSLLETRSTLGAEAYAAVSAALDENYFVSITKAEIVDISFSDSFETAIAAKVEAEQNKLRAQTEADQAKINAERDKSVAVTRAEAEYESAKKQADAAIETARGEADALRLRQAAWDNMSPETRAAMLQEDYLHSWDGKLPSTVLGSEASVMLPLQ
jgi:regulator of protease activity HflC (stomatin/prohibitin superfamily)